MVVIRDCIKLLSEGKTLTSEQLISCIKEIMTQEASPSQVGAFLVALRYSPVTPEVLFHSAATMLSFAVPCKVESQDIVLDIVGTGGDAFDTFNASTAAAIVVAATGLVKVAKHGNRSSSGRCGSADLVEALGAKLDIDSQQVSHCISELNFGFLFAQKFHPAMKSVSPIRKEIGIRTIFNMLGPLTNPAKPNTMLVGVGTRELGDLYSKVFALKGEVRKAMIVHSLDDGLDEITTAGKTHIWIVDDGKIIEKDIEPKDFGLSLHPIESILGSTPAENSKTFLRILNNEKDEKLQPYLEFVLLQSSAALVASGKVKDFVEGAQVALEAIKSGKALKVLQDYIKLSNSNAN